MTQVRIKVMFTARNSYSKAIKSTIFYQQGINKLMNTLTSFESELNHVRAQITLQLDQIHIIELFHQLIQVVYVFNKKHIHLNQSDKTKKSKKSTTILLFYVTRSTSSQYFSLTINSLKFPIKKVLEVISQMGINHRQISQNDGHLKFKNPSFFTNSKALLIKSALALITKNNHEKALLIKKKYSRRLQKEKLKQNCSLFQIYILLKLLVRKLTMLHQVIYVKVMDMKKIYCLFLIVFTINIETNDLINSNVMTTNAK